jgi:hypothetical protein
MCLAAVPHAKGVDVLPRKPWRAQPDGFYVGQIGDIRLLVEEVGARCRVVVSRITDDMLPEVLIYTASAANAHDAMAIAEHAAEREASRAA